MRLRKRCGRLRAMQGEESIGIVVSSGSIGAICGVIGMWLKSRMAPSEWVTRGECRKLMETMSDRLERIEDKLDELDRKDEKRICDVNRRIDPLVERLGRLVGEMEASK